MAAYFQILVTILVVTNVVISHPSRKRVTYVSRDGEPSNLRYISKVEENGEEVEEQKVKLNCQFYKKSEKTVFVKKTEEKDETQKPPVKKEVQKPSQPDDCKPVKTAEIIKAPNRVGSGCSWNSQRDAQGRCRPIA